MLNTAKTKGCHWAQSWSHSIHFTLQWKYNPFYLYLHMLSVFPPKFCMHFLFSPAETACPAHHNFYFGRRSQNSTVGTLIEVWVGQSVIWISAGEIFLFSETSRLALGVKMAEKWQPLAYIYHWGLEWMELYIYSPYMSSWCGKGQLYLYFYFTCYMSFVSVSAGIIWRKARSK